MLSPGLIVSALAACDPFPEQIWLAYSGGVDSHALLHLCAQDPALRARLIAVHVHHGLQVQADDWARHCEKVARELGVGFRLCRVDARPQAGESPEEAARNARYRALNAILAPGGVLLVAQHQDDQLETVLLNLMRGGGLLGLAGMPESMPFGAGVLLRPFLRVKKSQIDAYAQTHGLRWVEDPSNCDSVYDRNFLRQQILPLLRQRWPSCAHTVARAAAHCGEAHALLQAIGDEAFLTVYHPEDNTLDIAGLRRFDAPQRQLIVRQWFRRMGLKMPSQAFIRQLFDAVIAADVGRDPVLAAQGRQIRRYRDRLYCLETESQEILRDCAWPKGDDALTLGKHLSIAVVPSDAGIPLDLWRRAEVVVKFRGGGEKLALPGRQGRHELKKLFQEAGIPPWRRAALPLIYLDGHLAAVADLWIGAEFYHQAKGASIRFLLRRDPALEALNR